MENEELFAGEPALDAQLADAQRPAAASKQAPLQIHTEPLLADDDDWQQHRQQQHEERVRTIHGRPRWRQPHVSAFGGR